MRVSDEELEATVAQATRIPGLDEFYVFRLALDLHDLRAAARAALERLGGDAKDGNLGWHTDHPAVAGLRAAISEKEVGR